MSFADIESMVNAGNVALLANASLNYIGEIGDVSIDGVFSDGRNESNAIGALRGVREITFSWYAVDIGTLKAGTAVCVRETEYVVAKIERDKTGWVTLYLRGGMA